MECRIEDFGYKEVVNVNNGHRLGYVNDVLIDIQTGKVTALIVPGPYRVLGIFNREEDYVVPWDSIVRIGGDIILINVENEYRRSKREKNPGFKWQFGNGD